MKTLLEYIPLSPDTSEIYAAAKPVQERSKKHALSDSELTVEFSGPDWKLAGIKISAPEGYPNEHGENSVWRVDSKTLSVTYKPGTKVNVSYETSQAQVMGGGINLGDIDFLAEHEDPENPYKLKFSPGFWYGLFRNGACVEEGRTRGGLDAFAIFLQTKDWQAFDSLLKQAGEKKSQAEAEAKARSVRHDYAQDMLEKIADRLGNVRVDDGNAILVWSKFREKPMQLDPEKPIDWERVERILAAITELGNSHGMLN